MNAPPYRTRVIRRYEDLGSLAGEWEALLARSLHDSLFLTWEWMYTWAEVHVRAGRLLVIVVEHDGHPVAIAPLWVDQAASPAWLKTRVLRFLGTGHACSDHLDLIVQRKQAPVWIKAIWDELFGPLRGEWDVFEYSDVPSGSLVLQQLEELAEHDSRCLDHAFTQWTVCPYLPLAGTWEAFLSDLSKSRRYAVKASRAPWSSGDPSPLSLVAAQDLASELRRLSELNTRLWQERGQSGSFADPTFTKFHQLVAERLWARDRLFFGALTLGDRYCGALYGFVYRGVVYDYVFTAARSEQRQLNLGDALLSFSIEQAIARGCHELDFLRGAEPYKYLWTSSDRRNLTLRMYNRTFRAWLFLSFRALGGAIKRLPRVWHAKDEPRREAGAIEAPPDASEGSAVP